MQGSERIRSERVFGEIRPGAVRRGHMRRFFPHLRVELDQTRFEPLNAGGEHRECFIELRDLTRQDLDMAIGIPRRMFETLNAFIQLFWVDGHARF